MGKMKNIRHTAIDRMKTKNKHLIKNTSNKSNLIFWQKKK